jgi:putative transposase
VSAGVKGEILKAVEEAQAVGIDVRRACQMLQLGRGRYYAWVAGCHKEASDPLADGRPGPAPGEAPHRLLEEEKWQISALLKDEAYSDLSLPQLAVVASEKQLVQASASSFYRQARAQRLVRTREKKTPVKQTKPEVKAERPNQVWSWDITYLPFFGFYLYFVAILDVYSRKIVGWKLCFNATVESVKQAWDQALSSEGMLGSSEGPSRLTALSDHGSQMTAKSMACFFRDLGISQLFARYQTPKDNAWIEAFFRIFKHDWLCFQEVFSFHQLEGLIASFVDFYNQCRYHGAIGYVTPQQRHSGQSHQVLEARKKRKEGARERRLEVHRQQASRMARKVA